MPRFSFDSSPQIASGLALLFVFVLSMAVGLMAVASSQDIVQNVKNSSVVQMEER